MINTLTTTHLCGDVLGLALRQLIDAPCVTRILVADGPHTGPRKWGRAVDTPSVKAVVDRLASDKIVYQYTDDCEYPGEKCNRVLQNVSEDCQWILRVDADEVYHEDALARLAAWLPTAEYGRYSIKTVDPINDFYHHFVMPDRKPSLYRWFAGARCNAGYEGHQWVLHPKQKLRPGGRWGGFGRVPDDVCELYHLNAFRSHARARRMPDGTVEYHGGGNVWQCKIEPLARERIPRSVLQLGRATL